MAAIEAASDNESGNSVGWFSIPGGSDVVDDDDDESCNRVKVVAKPLLLLFCMEDGGTMNDDDKNAFVQWGVAAASIVRRGKIIITINYTIQTST